ncbi:DUF1266 domain-containing protein [Streptomyces sp. MST-110588]|nr:DUF1266 domain-containing protein [Streptomyces sp. MST-110588]
MWLRARAQGGVRPGGLLTTHFGGPLHGPLAHGLACGAPIAVHHSVPWNELGTVFVDHAADAQLLYEQWSVVDPASWRQRLEQLLNGQYVPAETEAALRARAANGPAAEAGTEEAEESAGAAGVAGAAETAGAEEGGTAPEDAEKDSSGTAGAGAAADAIASPADSSGSAGSTDSSGRPGLPALVGTYEDRFRTDGVLPAEGRVVSIVALDLVHAVNLVRWGLGARFCAPPEAEEAVLRAGAQAREVYSSWEEFSAGYVLGRMLAFDNGWFGSHYAEALHIHRVLTQDPSSPWKGLPFNA